MAASAIAITTAMPSTFSIHIKTEIGIETETKTIIESSSPPKPPPLHHGVAISKPSLETELVSPTGSDTAHEDFRKGVQAAAPLLSTISLGLIIHALPAGQPYLLIVAHSTSVYLALFLGLGLLMHSIFNPAGPEAAQPQKKAMFFAVAFLSVGVVLHVSVLLPTAYVRFVWPLFFLGVALILLYLLPTAEKNVGQQPVHDSVDRNRRE